MARMVPAYAEKTVETFKSQAEAKFYRWCRSLPDSITVFHNVCWVDRSPSGSNDGQTDFLICDERRGIMLVEVKGGGITYDRISGNWYTTNRHQRMDKLKKSPFEQATDNKHRLLRFLQSLPAWSNTFPTGKPLFGHAVAFPDVVDVSGLVSMSAPRELIAGTEQANGALDGWLRQAFRFHGGDVSRTALGPAGVTLIENAVFPAAEARITLVNELDEAEDVRIRLTAAQTLGLQHLRSQKRMSIRGAAGTGKTLMAIEKARALAAEGKRTALVCYNAPLASHLSGEFESIPNVSVFTFHELCRWAANEVRKNTGRDLIAETRALLSQDADEYEDVLPEALLSAAALIDNRFDAILVDEAQDLRDVYWVALEAMLDQSDGHFYIFVDENQRVYNHADEIPKIGIEYKLFDNCRNGKEIHDQAYLFYRGEPVHPFPLSGHVEWLEARSIPDGARAISRTVSSLLKDEKVSPNRITVLVAGEPKIDYIDALLDRSLPNGVKWLDGASRPNTGGFPHVLIDSVRRFKGLENDVVFVWGAEDAAVQDRSELLYVGFSRAKSALYIVGQRDNIERFAQAYDALEVTQ